MRDEQTVATATAQRSSEASSAPSNGELSGWQRIVVDEFPGILIAACAVVAGVSRIVPGLASITIPAIVTMAVGVAFRVFRFPYLLASTESALTGLLNRGERLVTDGVGGIENEIRDLRDMLESSGHHEASRCDRSTFYVHMLGALEAATKTVDLTQLDTHAPKHYGTPQMTAYFARQLEVVAERPTVKFRRIVAVPTLEKLSWLLDVLESVASYPNFQINYLNIAQATQLPAPLSLQIFDRRELCLVDPTLGYMLPEDQNNMLWVSGVDVAEVFSIYYDSIWRLATRVKEGSIIYWPFVRELLAELRTQHPAETDLADSLESRVAELSGDMAIRGNGERT